MTNLETVASPEVVTTIILSACVLGIAFMIRFFVALTLEERNPRFAHAPRPRDIHSQADIACAAAPSRMRAANPAAYVAMGVVRITTALASNAGRRDNNLSFNRLHEVALDRSRPELNFPAQGRYRSS